MSPPAPPYQYSIQPLVSPLIRSNACFKARLKIPTNSPQTDHPCALRTQLRVRPSKHTISTKRRSKIVTRDPRLEGLTRLTTIADPLPILRRNRLISSRSRSQHRIHDRHPGNCNLTFAPHQGPRGTTLQRALSAHSCHWFPTQQTAVLRLNLLQDFGRRPQNQCPD